MATFGGITAPKLELALKLNLQVHSLAAFWFYNCSSGNWICVRIEIGKITNFSIPPAPAAAAPSQKASSDDISGTKRGTIDPLVSKRPEKILK